MIYADIVQGKDGLDKQYAIRKKVFIEEQGVDESIERDDYDLMCAHVIVYEDKKPVGTGRIIHKEGKALIGRIAVLKEYRGKKYGDLIVRKLVDYGFRNGEETIEVHAQLQVLNFYEGIGFIAYGEEYYESSILHRSMVITKDAFYRPCS